MTNEKDIIGRETLVDFTENIVNIPAKIDTGADSSAVWASDIRVDENNLLHFKLFDKSSPYYTGEDFVSDKYSVASVRSASGDKTIKFRTYLWVKIKGRRVRALFGLSDRKVHRYPVLIGRRTLNGRFIVDVSVNENINPKSPKPHTENLNQELKKDPQKFYQKYYSEEK